MKRVRYRRRNPYIEWVARSMQMPITLHDGVLWGRSGRYLYSSADLWRTRTLVHDFGAGTTIREVLGVGTDTLIVGVDNTIVRTTDNGGTFTTVLTASELGSSFGLRSFARAPDTTLYAATYGDKNPSNGEVFRSTNDGETWAKVLDVVTDLTGFAATGTHIHGVHVDPLTSDVWLFVGDTPNSGILRCPGAGDVTAPDDWQLLSHATLNPIEFTGYPSDVRHQPIDAWFDDDFAYFSNDNRPWAVKAWRKSDGAWSLPLDYADFGMPNMNAGAYGLMMAGETTEYIYHGSRANAPENPTRLWRMDRATRVWELLWEGLPSPASGSHGFARIIPVTDSELIVVYLYGTSFTGVLRPPA